MFGVISRPSRSGAPGLGKKIFPRPARSGERTLGVKAFWVFHLARPGETCKLLGLKGSASSSGLAGLPEIAFWFALF